jgi:Hg(II)-responsive transcriptional regulator
VCALTTSQAARQAGVNPQTLRYYLKRGLLAPPPRSSSGYRRYSPEVVRRIRFIRRSQQLGFTLQEIKQLIDLRVRPGAACDDVRRRAVEKLADVEQKLRSLQKIRSALRGLVDSCRGGSDLAHCPILESLEDES